MKTIERTKTVFVHYRGTHSCFESYGKKVPFMPPMLPYSYSALDKITDTNNLKAHFLNFHMRGFEDFLDCINGTQAENMGMCQIFKHEDEFEEHLIETACVVFNHQLFWDNLCPYCGDVSPELQQGIQKSFGSLYKLQDRFVELGMKQTGRGWMWLIVNSMGQLELITTIKNENPVLKSALVKGSPVLAIDLWDHAYNSKFSNNKAEYLSSIWSIINWSEVSHRYRFSI